LHELYGAPTIGEMSQLIENRPQYSGSKLLVAIRPSGQTPPLFLVPGVGGSVLMFAQLAQRMPSAQPLFGLQPRGLDGVEDPFASIEEAATVYIAEMRT